MTARPVRLIAWCGILPTLLAALLCLSRPSVLARVELGVYDRLVRLAGTRPPSDRVLIVDVDERSLARVGQWPWSRTIIAELITTLGDLGARTIALDIMFAEEERGAAAGPSPEATLAEALRRGNVILGYALTFENEPPDRTRTCAQHPLSLAVVHAGDQDPRGPFFQATKTVCNVPILTEAAGASGFLNAAPDSDGILRRVPLVAEFDGKLLPSLALAAVSHSTRSSPALLRVANVNTSSLVIGGQPSASHPASGHEVPLDGKSNLLVRFRGEKRTFLYASATDVLSRTVPRDLVKDKIVLIGTTALGTREVVSTPLDTLFTGVEVQATVTDNLLQRDFFRQSEHGVALETLAVLMLGAAATLLGVGFGLTWCAAGTIVMVVAVWGSMAALMSAAGLVMSPLYPTLGLTTSMAAMTIAGLTLERRRADRAGEAREASQRLMVQTLLSLVETRDVETGRHSRRTQQYTRILAEVLATNPRFKAELTPHRIDLLAVLAPLHDIGKVGVPDRVLLKAGPLNDEELTLMRKHPVFGRDVILNAERAAGVRDDETLAIAKDIVYTHHEKWDGTGYPQGLRGADIPVAGRLIALVDVYDAMHSPRPYHRAMSHEEVMAIIIRGRGTHFDPDVVDACVAVAPVLKRLSEEPDASEEVA